MNPMLSEISPRVLEKFCKSLPEDEQDAFRRHQHPCQDNNYTGWIVARCCAGALQAELRNLKHFKRVEVGAWGRNSSHLWVLVVIVSQDCDWTPIPFYRGMMVRPKLEHENAPS
jgi:hypothetical protein